jgi:hypothetical protein
VSEGSLVFRPQQHFASGRVAVCCRCERLAVDAWPPGWLMGEEGFTCPQCAFPDRPELWR